MDSSSSVTFVEFLGAVSQGDLELLKKLVAKIESAVHGNREVNYAKVMDTNGCTSLHYAAGEGHTHICKYFIEILKFNVDVQDNSGQTSLNFAIRHHKTKVALYLVENGASMTITDKNGCIPLHIAASHGGGKELLQLFISKGADIEAVSDGGTALSRAATEGDIEAVEFLLQNNANVNPVNTPNNPLTRASLVSPECTQLLVKAGADPNIDFCGDTPLGLASVGNKVETIIFLLKVGANPNQKAFMGFTPLEMAAYFSNNVEVVKVLFPVTTSIPYIKNWSVEGVIEYVKSREFKEKMVVMRKEFVEKAKVEAAEAFKREEYWVAINWYIRALREDRYNATLYSNRSLCFARMNRAHGALYDAREAIKLMPKWAKPHCREGAALMLFKKYNEAAKSYSNALKLDPNNLEIQKALQEALEAEAAHMSI